MRYYRQNTTMFPGRDCETIKVQPEEEESGEDYKN
jgi:hypothetical protein